MTNTFVVVVVAAAVTAADCVPENASAGGGFAGQSETPAAAGVGDGGADTFSQGVGTAQIVASTGVSGVDAGVASNAADDVDAVGTAVAGRHPIVGAGVEIVSGGTATADDGAGVPRDGLRAEQPQVTRGVPSGPSSQLESSVCRWNGLSVIILTMAVATHRSTSLDEHELGERCDYFNRGYATTSDY